MIPPILGALSSFLGVDVVAVDGERVHGGRRGIYSLNEWASCYHDAGHDNHGHHDLLEDQQET